LLLTSILYYIFVYLSKNISLKNKLECQLTF